MQAILVELIEEFEFSLPPTDNDGPMEVLRAPLGLMCPVVKGRFHEGIQMPLMVKMVAS